MFSVITNIYNRKTKGPTLRRIHTYHAVPLLFPCHAVLLRVKIVTFPFDLHSAAVFDSHIPCRSHAVPRPFPCCSPAVLLPCRSAKGLDRDFSILFTQCGRV